jgi:hypothetical protein
VREKTTRIVRVEPPTVTRSGSVRSSQRVPPGVWEQNAAAPSAAYARRQVTPESLCEVRSLTEALAAPLSPEDQTVQSMPDAMLAGDPDAVGIVRKSFKQEALGWLPGRG